MMFIGAVLNLVLLIAWVGLYVALDQPPAHLLDQTSNHLAYQRGGIEQKVGKLLLRSGLADDWNSTSGHINTHKNPNPLIIAANPDRQYPYQSYNTLGKPVEHQAGLFLPPMGHPVIDVNTSKEVLSAIKNATPGTIITLAPGHYRFTGESIPVVRTGTANKPIYIRSAKLGSVTLEMNLLEGFHIKAPFWVFENLEIKGVCANDSRCEHAFHVVGKGKSFTLRNSKLVDFNAPVKVNGVTMHGSHYFPDNGLLEYNVFLNTRPRKTSNPVTLLNINSVDNWVVRGNFIADFGKDGGDHTSYGAFMKGGGRNGLFERNLIVCEHRLAADRGIRIGLSFGGGGTGKKFCRDKSCTTEHSNGLMRNNIVLNCSHDVGIYLNRAADSQIYNNLLHNNLGIDVRFPSSSATIINNIISGRIKEREGGTALENNNMLDNHCVGQKRSGCGFDKLYSNLDSADFRLNLIENPIWGAGISLDLVTDDFCGNPRGATTDLGPIQYSQGLACLQP